MTLVAGRKYKLRKENLKIQIDKDMQDVLFGVLTIEMVCKKDGLTYKYYELKFKELINIFHVIRDDLENLFVEYKDFIEEELEI